MAWALEVREDAVHAGTYAAAPLPTPIDPDQSVRQVRRLAVPHLSHCRRRHAIDYACGTVDPMEALIPKVQKRSGRLARTNSTNPIIRVTVEIGHVAGQLFVCIGVCFGQWFIGIRRLP